MQHAVCAVEVELQSRFLRIKKNYVVTLVRQLQRTA
jgi:hypothetical protein